MNTTELEVIRREAMEEEKKEKEFLRQKYKQRKNEKQEGNILDPEKQALIEQAHQEEQEERELLRQKYKERKNWENDFNTLDPEKQALIEQAHRLEQQERELLRQKYKQKIQLHQPQQTGANTTEKELTLQQEKEELRKKLKKRQENIAKENLGLDQSKKALNSEEFENQNIFEEFEDDNHNPHTENDNQREILTELIQEVEPVLEKEIIQKEEIQGQELIHKEELASNDVFENNILSENLAITEDETEELKNEDIFENSPEYHKPDTESYNYLEIQEETLNQEEELSQEEDLDDDNGIFYLNSILSEDSTTTELDEELVSDEEIDRSALLAKYNIKDIQEDDVNHILENFDRPKIDENIEIIEERIVSNIKKTALSHPKIEWVNVLVFLDDEELEGSIKVHAEYNNGNLLNRIISENTEKLEVELIQIALYEVWDVFTTLGVVIDDLESKIDVEVELDRA